jgi:hypothetical protein
MSDRFINLEIGGAPLVMYGAIATTVAVIAYATVSGGFGESATNAIGMNPVPSSSSAVEPTAETSPNNAEQTTGGAKKNKKTSSLKKGRSHKKSRKTPKKN